MHVNDSITEQAEHDAWLMFSLIKLFFLLHSDELY